MGVKNTVASRDFKEENRGMTFTKIKENNVREKLLD